MPTASTIALANAALLLLGSDTLESFDEGTERAEIVAALLDDTVRAVLVSYPWRSTLRKVRLAREVAAPINEWRYSHKLPVPCLLLRELRTSAAVGAAPLREYEIFDGAVLSNRPDLWADYQVQTEPATWPAYLTNAMRHALASVLAVPITESAERADYFGRLAYGTPAEAGQGGLMGVARRLDAQQQPPQVLDDFPLIAARNGGWR